MSVDAKPAAAVEKSDLVSVYIDGTEVKVPKGTMAIRAAELIGVAIPRFCDHPLLDPMGACRQCLVEVPDAGNGRGFPKPQASCTLEVAPGMKIETQVTSAAAKKSQEGIMELLLINHPLDCPICDKGGECPLQNQAIANGRPTSRYDGVKRTFPKPVSISAQILLDRERCVLCARCTRFSEQIAGDPFIALVERGALQQVGIFEEHPYDSYFSGNVVQICPVGALTSADYRFQSRPFDLVSTVTTCEHCASGCQLRTDQRHFQVKRRLAGDLPEVNEEWNCDRGRFAFTYGRGDDRLDTPLVRDGDVLRPASWPEAIDVAVAGLKAAGTSVGVLPGGRLTLENAYGYAKFARAVLGTNNIDHRSRPSSAEELGFLASQVAGRRGVTYADLETATRVVLVSFEPEEESPIVFLRLRKAVRKKGLKVVAIAPFLSGGNAKLHAELVATAPGGEAAALAELTADEGTIILVGERAATSAGALTASVEAAARTGARLAWIPRRAGEIGAVDAGCLPTVLPGGRPLDAAARVDLASVWGVESLPATPGLDADGIVAALASGRLKAAIVGGVQPTDFADADAVRSALEGAPFVISLETRVSEVTERADVVFPVVLVEQQSGTFLNWEHRRGAVNRVIKDASVAMTDLRVLAALADAMGRDLGVRQAGAALAEFDELGQWEGDRAGLPAAPAASGVTPSTDALTLASWRQLIDGSASNAGAPELIATAHAPLVRVSPKTAAAIGAGTGDDVTVTVGHRGVTLPLAVEPTMVDGVVWIPGNFFTGSIGELAAGPGAAVTVTRGGAA